MTSLDSNKEYEARALARLSRARSPLAFLFREASRFGLLRSRVIRAICKLEGGQMWSVTYRELMKVYYGIEIGMHSYGPALWPGGMHEGTRIGNYCSLAAGISVFRRNHPTNRFSQHPFFFNAASGLIEDDTICAVHDHPLIVGDDVWIGGNAIITPRCNTIGLGAVVAAGAVVTKDVPPFTIVGGIPARPIGERFSREIQQVLVESRWWEHPLERLVPVMPLFLKDSTLENAQQLREHIKSYSLAR